MPEKPLVTNVWDICSDCGNTLLLTSSAGSPEGKDYDLTSAPMPVIADLIGKQTTCDKCGRVYRVFGAQAAFLAPVSAVR